ncbi:T9SS type A sorting domain-containing protein [Polluticaenibacter yanchengensis]|uniref:T9SS type A sorting domain-containing protein n=1 Tax=Polluticaenibacter yanchengensis TaxID=3014562 RepID=A0ABT4UEX5_9BACT|nr:T9SS type A sorting domain-containing protein [Chitinophagaceae bacterium LY-5]
MKKTFTLMLMLVLCINARLFAQCTSCDFETVTIASMNQQTVFKAGKTYCIKSNLSFGSSYPVKLEAGTIICINPNVTFSFEKLANNSGPATFNVYGTLNFNNNLDLNTPVAVNVFENGKVNGNGNIKLTNNTSTATIFTVKAGGTLQVGGIDFNGNAPFIIDNYGVTNTQSQFNASNVNLTVRNQGVFTMGNNFNLGQNSKLYNCGIIYLNSALNLGNGRIYNTGSFKSNGGQINMQNNDRFENYGYVEIQSLNAGNNNTLLYNEGVFVVKGGIQNGRNITGPTDNTKTGYFVVGEKFTIQNNPNIGPNLNFKMSSKTGTDNNATALFQQPGVVNGKTNITFKDCDGSTSCTGLGTPQKTSGVCLNLNGDKETTKDAPFVVLFSDGKNEGLNTPQASYTKTNEYIKSNQLNVVLVNSEGKVERNITLNDGYASFASLPQNTAGYKVIISSVVSNVGDFEPTPNLPNNYVFTKTNFNAVNPHSTNGKIILPNTKDDLVSINIGIQQRPKSDSKIWSVDKDENGDPVVLGKKYVLGAYEGSVSPISLTGSDEEDSPAAGSLGSGSTFKVITLPKAGAANLYYNNVLVSENQEIANFNPRLLSIEFLTPMAMGNSLTFTYSVIDQAGFTSLTPATYNIFSAGAVLPVGKVNLAVSEVNGKNELTWGFIYDAQVKAFEVEKSIDGVNFVKLGTVVYNSTVSKYGFSDNNITPQNYYRIKLVDVNGKGLFSNTVVKRSVVKSAVQVYPNPVISEANVEFSKAGKYNVSLIDLAGKTLQSNTQDITNGGVVKINRRNFTSGTYIIRVINVNDVTDAKTFKVVFN